MARVFRRFIGNPVSAVAADRANVSVPITIVDDTTILHHVALTLHNTSLMATWVKVELASDNSTATLNDAVELFSGWMRAPAQAFAGGGTAGTSFTGQSMWWDGEIPLSLSTDVGSSISSQWFVRGLLIVQNGQGPAPFNLSAIVSQEIP